MDRGTKRCFKHVFLDANDVQLCALRRASGDQTIFAGCRIHHPGVNGKADAGYLAVYLNAFGFLAFETHSIQSVRGRRYSLHKKAVVWAFSHMGKDPSFFSGNSIERCDFSGAKK